MALTPVLLLVPSSQADDAACRALSRRGRGEPCAETSQALSWLILTATVWGKKCHPSVTLV